jgi:hypothetical protein
MHEQPTDRQLAPPTGTDGLEDEDLWDDEQDEIEEPPRSGKRARTYLQRLRDDRCR